jgi:hypothetical protein
MAIGRFTGTAVFALLLLGMISVSQGGAPAGDRPGSPKRLLLLGQGPDGHPPQTHEFRAGLKLLKTCLDRVEGLEAALVDASEP